MDSTLNWSFTASLFGVKTLGTINLEKGSTMIIIVASSVQPKELVAISFTSRLMPSPFLEKMCEGLGSLEPEPSPKFQLYEVAPVLVFVKSTLRGAGPLTGLAVKPAFISDTFTFTGVRAA